MAQPNLSLVIDDATYSEAFAIARTLEHAGISTHVSAAVSAVVRTYSVMVDAVHANRAALLV